MGTSAISLGFTLVALGTVSCMAAPPAATVQQLMQRASYDLQCPLGYMGLYHLDSLTKVVSGCGRRLVYEEQCQSSAAGAACTWRLEPTPVAIAPVAFSPSSPPVSNPTPYAPAAGTGSAPPPPPKSPVEYLPRDL